MRDVMAASCCLLCIEGRSFDFPPPGARVAELVPPPAPGSATSGAVVRVVCPAVVVRLRKDGAERVLERGAHVRSR